MNIVNGSGPPGPQLVKKLEAIEDRGGGKDIKPVKTTLNRVPRACNACRKQKMRCEGAENPPCKRCRQQSLDCLFEKPNREASLTGEAGLERIRSLETHVMDIRQSQTAIQNTLVEIVNHLRVGSAGIMRSPSAFPSTYMHPSPNVHADSPASMSTPVSARPPLDSSHSIMSTSQPGSSMYASPSMAAMRTNNDGQASQVSQGNTAYQSITSQYHLPPGVPPTTLPPLSSIDHIGPRPQPDNLSSVRHQHTDSGHSRHFDKQPSALGGPGATKRPFPISTATSADTSDEDDDGGGLPASGLVAPWEVLRGLADVAIQRAAKENDDASEPQSRTRSPSPDPRSRRPSKKRRVHNMPPRILKFPDVVSKGIISESEALDLFKIFFHGCSTFLPIFDFSVDTFASLHERSPFAVDSICMVAAKVRDGGGKPSDVYSKCLQEVQSISCATLFAPVLRVEAVQAMILVSGWSDNGWLSGGHAVRMALEVSLHKAWPKLLRRIEGNKASDGPEDRELVIAARTWFCLYLFEHQMSYGTGRPAILTDNESIWQCSLLLRHPLTIEDDMRLVSMVELMAIRERITNHLSPFLHGPVDERTFEILRSANAEFAHWYQTWDQSFSQKYEDATFYRQSLQIQQLHAELYHSATGLRGINGPEDVSKMPNSQREVAIKSIQIARQILDMTVNSPSYREGMKYAVHYTHATATFAASFLLRLARLFPNECNVTEIRERVETLASLMSEIPGKRYALTLQLMLKRSMKRKSGTSRSPKLPRESYQSKVERPASMAVNQVVNPTPPTMYDASAGAMVSPQGFPVYPATHPGYVANAEYIWRGFETTSTEQLPVWLSDQSLGGNQFSQSGIDAFLLPPDYLPPAPQIW